MADTFPMITAAWAEFEWPDWVPDEVRGQIESFWSERYGRGPSEWKRTTSERYQNAPDFGERVTLPHLCHEDRPEEEPIEGRYVHAWNNIGRVVRDDGTWGYVSTCSYKRPTTTEAT